MCLFLILHSFQVHVPYTRIFTRTYQSSYDKCNKKENKKQNKQQWELNEFIHMLETKRRKRNEVFRNRNFMLHIKMGETLSSRAASMCHYAFISFFDIDPRLFHWSLEYKSDFGHEGKRLLIHEKSEPIGEMPNIELV